MDFTRAMNFKRAKGAGPIQAAGWPMIQAVMRRSREDRTAKVKVKAHGTPPQFYNRRIKMKTRRLLLAGVISSLLLLVAGTGGRALASPPDIQVINVDETFPAVGITRFCGFPVLRHDQLTIRAITFYNQNGVPRRELDLLSGTATFTANGKSVVGMQQGIESYTFNPDGTTTALITGPRMVVLPGVGPVFGFTGTTRLVFDADGNLISFEGTGPSFTNPAVCSALAP
jgi:hypothetical protein